MFENKVRQPKPRKNLLRYLIGVIIGWLTAYGINYLFGLEYLQYLVAIGVVFLVIITLFYVKEGVEN